MYDDLWKLMNNTGYKDYKESNGLFSICSCKGRPPKDKPKCERNQDELKSHTGQGYCMYFKGQNGTKHCDHKHPYKQKEEETE
jgi:hypothetical protein